MLPGGELLEQSDGTAWMAKFCLNMLEMALRLANHDRAYEDVALKFFEHFASIAAAMSELWDEEDGFFYDRLRMPDGSTVPLRARSMVGLLPIFAAVELERVAVGAAARLPQAGQLVHRPQAGALPSSCGYFAKDERPELIALVDEPRLRRVLARMLDEAEFLSPYGLRSLSRYHREHPLVVAAPRRRGAPRLRAGRVEERDLRRQLELARADLVPAELPGARVAAAPARRARARASRSSCRPARACRRTSAQVADELERRLLRLFLLDARGRRPVYGETALFQTRPGVARPHPVLRVLPRRHGRGAGRVAPDGVDGARGSADRRAPRSRG